MFYDVWPFKILKGETENSENTEKSKFHNRWGTASPALNIVPGPVGLNGSHGKTGTLSTRYLASAVPTAARGNLSSRPSEMSRLLSSGKNGEEHFAPAPTTNRHVYRHDDEQIKTLAQLPVAGLRMEEASQTRSASSKWKDRLCTITA